MILHIQTHTHTHRHLGTPSSPWKTIQFRWLILKRERDTERVCERESGEGAGMTPIHTHTHTHTLVLKTYKVRESETGSNCAPSISRSIYARRMKKT